jgi:hypothetical protein
MRTLTLAALILCVATATGCVDLKTEVTIPESAFDGLGIDVIGTAASGGIVTKDMVSGDVYTSPKPVRVEFVDGYAVDNEKAAAEKAAAKEIAEMAIAGVLGEDTRWFKSWRGLRTLPDPAEAKAAAEKAEAKKVAAAKAAAEKAEAAAEAAATEAVVIAALGEDTRWFKNWRSPRTLPFPPHGPDGRPMDQHGSN